MAQIERAQDPGRRGQLLLLDGEPAAVVTWVHDADDRPSTGWFLQLLDADGEATGPAHKLRGPAGVTELVETPQPDREAWIRQAETVELLTATTALEMAETVLAHLRGR
jgi:hypothetical protein